MGHCLTRFTGETKSMMTSSRALCDCTKRKHCFFAGDSRPFSHFKFVSSCCYCCFCWFGLFVVLVCLNCILLCIVSGIVICIIYFVLYFIMYYIMYCIKYALVMFHCIMIVLY